MELTNARRQKIQLELAFSRDGGGETSAVSREGTEVLVADRVTQSPECTEQLMEEVVERENLKQALKRVQSNKGGPGIDKMTVDELPAHLKENWRTIREQLLRGTYRPQSVKRVDIPKSGGGVRKLGIPTALDRFVQQAVLQVLQRRWDPTFSEHSYGFRPGRSAHQAIAQAQRYVRDGYTVVVDFDLENFFDGVNHDRLMSRIADRVSDKRMLRLIRSFLTAGVMEHGVVGSTRAGTPQGGPISSLLSNVVPDELDRELERRGHRFCRYADDCNIYVGSLRAGERVMVRITEFITSKLKLRINQAKSRVAPVWGREFLGFSVTRGAARKRIIGKKAMGHFKERIREITRRNRGVSLAQVVSELATYIRGWVGYFGFCEARSVLQGLDSWVRRRLRCFIWKKWKTFQRRRRGLMERGIAEAPASQTAARSRGCWSTSNVPPLRRAFPIAYFNALGLPRMFVQSLA